MAQNRPLTGAAQNFFSQFNAGQERQRQAEILQLAQQKRQDTIDAAVLKRQQEVDDREDLALSIEGAIGVDTSGELPDGEQRGPGRVDGFVFGTDRSRKAFSQAVANNPSVSAPILNFLSKSSDFQIKQRKRTTDRRFRAWNFLQEQNKKGPVQFQEGIKQLVESGLFSESEQQKMVKISNEPNPDLVNLTIEKGISDTEPEQILIDDELAKRSEARAEGVAIRQEARAEETTVGLEGRAEQAAIRKEGRVEQADIRKGARTEAADLRKLKSTPQSKLGKLIFDKENLLKTSGPQSKQVRSLDDAIIAEAGLGFKVPLGFQLADPNDPTKGVIPIKGGPKDNLTGENAAKAQMLRTALKAFQGNKAKGLPGVRELVFTKDSKGENIGLNDVTLFNANFSIPFTDIRGVPFTKGDRLRTQMEFGIQAATRSETGAAMPPEEVENTRTRFMPKVTDTLTTATLKLDMFEDFLKGTLQLVDPTGRFNEARFNSELVARGGEVTPSETNQPQRKVRVKF